MCLCQAPGNGVKYSEANSALLIPRDSRQSKSRGEMAAESLDVAVWLCIFQMNNNVFFPSEFLLQMFSVAVAVKAILIITCAMLRFGFAMTVCTDSTAHLLVMFLWSSYLHAFHIIDCLCRVWWVSAAEMWAARLRKAVKFRPLTVHSRRKTLRDGDWRSSHTVWFSGRAFADYHPITVTVVYLTSCPVPKIPTSCLATSDSIFDRKVSKSIFPSVRCCVIKA